MSNYCFCGMVCYNIVCDDEAHAHKMSYRQWHNKDKNYNIIRYTKSEINAENVSTLGVFRSLITRDKRLLVFSPPKGLQKEDFMKKYTMDECRAEEYVEGTMINLFYDDNEWEIASRSSVGANLKIYKHNHKEPLTFRSMFLEACNNANFDFDELDKTCSYSFVLQHPNNRIVVPFAETKLYLVACYKILSADNEGDSFSIETVDINSYQSKLADTAICFPKQYTNASYAELQTQYASSDTDYKIVGVMIHHKETGERTKIRNPNYEMVRQLRGNNPKELYHYLVIRREKLVSKYLKYYPEDQNKFNEYRQSVYNFTNVLYNNYVVCYISKGRPLRDFPYQYRTHMYLLHQLFLNELRKSQQYVSKKVVIKYVNELPPAKLMFAINYENRSEILDHTK